MGEPEPLSANELAQSRRRLSTPREGYQDYNSEALWSSNVKQFPRVKVVAQMVLSLGE